tara:strand:+ start:436 stop:564 length:129 start_codon:yes stop_codon:yes gene_type:complete
MDGRRDLHKLATEEQNEEPSLKKFDRDAFIKSIINDDNQGER